ncbi:MAG: transglycosylase domain-containing protein [Candidatus Eisenbacteria bacterium]|nr:transglycosylase domain-containing protein [Candidatus Eisenbacteria bacterium]
MAGAQGSAGRLSARRVALLALAAAILLAAVLPALIVRLAAARLTAAARSRSLAVSWRVMRFEPPVTIRLAGLTAVSARGDTVCRIDSLRVAIAPLSVLALHPRVLSLTLAHARVRIPPGAAADADTLAPEETVPAPARIPAARGASAPLPEDHTAKVRRSAQQMVRTLLLPARRLPRLELSDVTLAAGDPAAPLLRVSWMSLAPAGDGVRFAGSGALLSEHEVRFDFALRYGDDDRIAGGARFGIPDRARGTFEPLRASFDGRIHQDRRHGVITLGDSVRVRIGRLPLRLGGSIDRDPPRIRLRLDAEGWTATLCRQSLPAPLLGPLGALDVQGAWDYHAWLDLDFANPDSVKLGADVVPHRLSLGTAPAHLALGAIARPFTATVHLPHDHLETRDISFANPHFLPLDEIDPTLAYAVVTNEDGGFFRHRGFNLEAVRGAIADNIRAGRYRRGAGTITMQLVRNLYLGHARTLSRKAQEVVLAWVIENLAGIDKRRMLEVYLNLIEWGPGALGADEAAHYYFGHDARRLTVSEALFMTTVLPAPAKWRWRFDPDGTLRPFERAQMHFIGRAMIAKGWLRPDRLPPVDSLGVELRGPARGVLFAPGVAAALDSLRTGGGP